MLGNGRKVLILEQCAGSQISCGRFCDRLRGERRWPSASRGQWRGASGFVLAAASWDNDRRMPNATITVDAALKERLADLAGQTGQHVDEFVEALLRRIADADVRFERGVPVLPRRPGAPTLSIDDVDRLAEGTAE